MKCGSKYSPFCNFLVSPEDTVLYVYRVISHPSQYESLVQSSDNKHGVVIF